MDYAEIGKGIAAEAAKHLPKWIQKLKLPLVSMGMLLCMTLVASSVLHDWYLYLLIIPYSFLLNDFVALVAHGGVFGLFIPLTDSNSLTLPEKFKLTMGLVPVVLPFFVGATVFVNSTFLIICNSLYPHKYLWLIIGAWLNPLSSILYLRLFSQKGFAFILYLHTGRKSPSV
jgi:hypothetical protein